MQSTGVKDTRGLQPNCSKSVVTADYGLQPSVRWQHWTYGRQNQTITTLKCNTINPRGEKEGVGEGSDERGFTEPLFKQYKCVAKISTSERIKRRNFPKNECLHHMDDPSFYNISLLQVSYIVRILERNTIQYTRRSLPRNIKQSLWNKIAT